jgi:hypothetical protein
MMDYSLTSLILWVTGSAVAAAVGRSFRSGLWAYAWAAVLGAPAACCRDAWTPPSLNSHPRKEIYGWPGACCLSPAGFGPHGMASRRPPGSASACRRSKSATIWFHAARER